MESKNRTLPIFKFAIWAAVLFVVFLAVFACSPAVANAVLPESYVSEVTSKGLDWWSEENFLNLARLEKTVDSWFDMEQYDMAAMERDPIVVAVIDSGINPDHSLFLGKYDDDGKAVSNRLVGDYDVLYRKNGSVVCKNTVSKKNYDYSPGYKVVDDSKNMHGTHVAGIIAALIHRLDLEKYIKIMPIKAGYPNRKDDNSTFNLSDVQTAVQFALDNGADVVNMSISSKKDDTNFDIVTKDMASKAIFVAAAGNEGWNSDESGTVGGKIYPAAGQYCIGVMNYAKSDMGTPELYRNRASGKGSNYGSAYQLCAPGGAIVSSYKGTDGYQTLNGTSMASPVVAFGSALALLKYRAIGAKVGRSKSVSEVTEIVKNSYSSTIETGISSLPVFDINMLAAGEDVAYAYIDADIDLTRNLGDKTPIRFALKIVPEQMKDRGSVKWFVDDAQTAEGFGFEYVPKAELGETRISAVWSFTIDGEADKLVTADVIVTVAPQPPTREFVESMRLVYSDDGKIVGKNLYAGESYRFTLSRCYQCADTVATNMRWYVDGTLTHVGKEFIFSPTEAGTYTISVKVGSYTTQKFTLTVKEAQDESKTIILWSSVGTAVSLIVTVVSVIIAIVVRRRRMR